MAPHVVSGAVLMCSFGVAPSSLTVLPDSRVTAAGQPAAKITDCQPMANIAPFGMCISLANPQVAAATSAALGVLTPQPCIPVTTPWQPGSTSVMVAGTPALTATCTCQCAWAGQITITMPGQMTVQTA
ncbi:MAG TPA: DUF4280 domain-containing protein [Acidimicrobiales bacterium]|jgi:hypothetical protein|nr:DUF4280 domain-containing protein [Acidimicrobiales bacterium]